MGVNELTETVSVFTHARGRVLAARGELPPCVGGSCGNAGTSPGPAVRVLPPSPCPHLTGVSRCLNPSPLAPPPATASNSRRRKLPRTAVTHTPAPWDAVRYHTWRAVAYRGFLGARLDFSGFKLWRNALIVIPLVTLSPGSRSCSVLNTHGSFGTSSVMCTL